MHLEKYRNYKKENGSSSTATIFHREYGGVTRNIPSAKDMLPLNSLFVKDNSASPERKLLDMAKTKSSKSGVQQKKIVPVKSYTKKDGTKVDQHRRSTPN